MKQPPSSDSAVFAPADSDLTTRARAVLAEMDRTVEEWLTGELRGGDEALDHALMEARRIGLLDENGYATDLADEVARLLAEDVFTAPIEEVNDELRRAGFDPDAVARRGVETMGDALDWASALADARRWLEPPNWERFSPTFTRIARCLLAAHGEREQLLKTCRSQRLVLEAMVRLSPKSAGEIAWTDEGEATAFGIPLAYNRSTDDMGTDVAMTLHDVLIGGNAQDGVLLSASTEAVAKGLAVGVARLLAEGGA